MAIVRIMFERFLHLQYQAIEAAPHVSMTRRQLNSRAIRDRNHHRRSRTSMTRANVAASTPLSTITRRPPVSTISIRPDATTARGRSGYDGRLLFKGSQLINTTRSLIA